MKKYCYDLVSSMNFWEKVRTKKLKLIQTTEFSQPDACNSSFKINCKERNFFRTNSSMAFFPVDNLWLFILTTKQLHIIVVVMRNIQH